MKVRGGWALFVWRGSAGWAPLDEAEVETVETGLIEEEEAALSAETEEAADVEGMELTAVSLTIPDRPGPVGATRLGGL